MFESGKILEDINTDEGFNISYEVKFLFTILYQKNLEI